MPGVVRRGHSNNAGQPTTVTFVASDATAAAAAAAAEEAVAPVQEQLDELTAAIETGTIGSASLSSVDLILPRGRRSGHIDIEPEGGFTENQVGAPVMVTIAPNQGAIEAVLFAGEVLTTRKMRLHWSAPGPAPTRVVVNYIIGSR